MRRAAQVAHQQLDLLGRLDRRGVVGARRRLVLLGGRRHHTHAKPPLPSAIGRQPRAQLGRKPRPCVGSVVTTDRHTLQLRMAGLLGHVMLDSLPERVPMKAAIVVERELDDVNDAIAQVLDGSAPAPRMVFRMPDVPSGSTGRARVAAPA